jgi:hypothetical protein
VSTGSTIAIVVGAGIFLILAGVTLLIINRLPVSGGRTGSVTGSRGLTEPVLVVAGAACLIVCVIFNGSRGSTERVSSGSATTPAAVTPVQSSSSTPALDPSASNPASSPQSGGSAESVSVSFPKAGSKVEQCQVFKGTSNLTPDKTIVLAMSNATDPTKTLYLEPVHNWQTPNTLSHWTGIQYFGSGDNSASQIYHIDVVIMNLSQVRQAEAIPSNSPTWSTTAMPQGSHVTEELSLTRIPGAGPATCQ